VFVTGAEGFAGTFVAELLRQRGYNVVAGVRNRARKLAYERTRGKAIVCDVSDPINVARAVAGVRPDGIVHLAGCSQPATARHEPLEAYQSIVTGWAALLDAVRRFVPRARVLLISACDVYGPASRDGQPAREDTPTSPTSTFGAFKVAAEWLARMFFNAYHLNLTVARPFHYIGPGQPPTSFFGSVARRLATWDAHTDGDELALPDLDARRDLLHVRDVAAAYERLLVDGRPNEVYNVCSGRTFACREVVEILLREARLPVRIVDSPGKDDGELVPVYHGDNTKLRTELGWQPTCTVQGAAAELIRSYDRGAVAARTV